MSDIVDQAKLYHAKGYYSRERKERWGLGWFLRPSHKHEVYNGRDFFSVDSLQSVFGYFFGGGWVFGLVENTTCRIESGSISAYEEKSGSQKKLPVKFRVGDVKGQRVGVMEWGGGLRPNIDPKAKARYVELIVHRQRLPHVDAVPPVDALRTIDQLALKHDKELRQADEIEWRKHSPRTAETDIPTKKEANEHLLTALRNIDWEAERQALDLARPVLSDEIWRGMRRLLKYECFLAQFSADALDLVFDPIELTPTLAEARQWLRSEQPQGYSLGTMRTSRSDAEVAEMSPRLGAAARAMRVAESHFADFE